MLEDILPIPNGTYPIRNPVVSLTHEPSRPLFQLAELRNDGYDVVHSPPSSASRSNNSSIVQPNAAAIFRAVFIEGVLRPFSIFVKFARLMHTRSAKFFCVSPCMIRSFFIVLMCLLSFL